MQRIRHHQCGSLAVFLLGLTLNAALPCVAAGQTAAIDFRYGPEYWFSAIGPPGDHHKTLLDDQSALLYDFGPGPYVTPGTRVYFAPPSTGAVRTQWTSDARVPIVTTKYDFAIGPTTVQAYSLPPAVEPAGRQHRVRRIGGLTGTQSWAHPPAGFDPAFQNVAWGTNRPIEYQVSVPPGARKTIALGFCESYRTVPKLRNLLIVVEGSKPVAFDPLAAAPSNRPQAIVVAAEDVDHDGIIRVEVLATQGDPNTILNVLWVFGADRTVDNDSLLSGALSTEAESYVDAGMEPQVMERAPRFDVLRWSGTTDQPVLLRIETRRHLSVRDGVVYTNGYPFLLTDVQASSWRYTDTGLELTFDPTASTIAAVVQDGFVLDPAQFPSWRTVRDIDDVAEFWHRRSGVPSSSIVVPDSVLQEMIDASIRTVYQMSEPVDGVLQAQPGAALYRGLWMHDGVFFADLMAQLGDLGSARAMTQRLLSFQQPSGKAEIMRPNPIHRETPLLLWALCRYAELSDDYQWLDERWDHVESGVAWIRALRDQTLIPGAPNYGLTPSGFADGGIHGVQPEYASVNWVLIALPAVIRAATRLGHHESATEWNDLYHLFLSSFKEAAERDTRYDEFGNAYLPVRVGAAGSDDLPQRAQWSIPEALAFGEHILPTDDLATGTLRMLDANKVQGLVASVGWLDGGIWAYYGGFLAEAYLRMGDGQRAAEFLYAMANHASPVFTWPEEQMPVGQGRRTAGDFPHAWASSTIPRVAIRLLAFEDGRNLTLFRGLPIGWLRPGAGTRLLGVPTRFGRATISLDVSENGDEATIRVDRMPGIRGRAMHIDWTQFAAAGFKTPDSATELSWNQDYVAILNKRPTEHGID